MNQWTICEYENGDKITYLNGKVHSRHENPAVTTAGAPLKQYLIWFKEGKIHRETGPAVYSFGGCSEWWLEGKQYSYEEWKKILNKD